MTFVGTLYYLGRLSSVNEWLLVGASVESISLPCITAVADK
jgi:hypothetical protein